MKKILLDFDISKTPSQIQEYLMEKFEFPPYYGKNLDALYDCLTEISEPVAIGFHMPMASPEAEGSDLAAYLQKVRRVFEDAENANSNIAIIDT